VLVFKRVEVFSERMSSKLYFWEFNVIVLSVPAPSGEKSDDSKDSCYEDLSLDASPPLCFMNIRRG